MPDEFEQATAAPGEVRRAGILLTEDNRAAIEAALIWCANTPGPPLYPYAATLYELRRGGFFDA